MNDQSVTYRIVSLPFSVTKKLETKIKVTTLQNLLVLTLMATMILPYRWVFALVIVNDVLGLVLCSKADRKLKVIDVLMAVFNIEVVVMFAIFSQTEELAQCMIIIVSLVLFYFTLCLYMEKERLERLFVLCCSFLSLERILAITISAEKWHDNRYATFQLLVFAIPLCLKKILQRRYPWKTKIVYAFLALVIVITVLLPFFYSGWKIFEPNTIINTLNDYRLPLGTALLEFVQNVLTTLSSLNPIFSVCAVLSILLLVLLILTETLSEGKNPLTLLSAALAVAGGGVSGFLAENIRIGLWQNINLLIVFWMLIAVVTVEE